MADKCEAIIGEAMAEMKAAFVNHLDQMNSAFARLTNALAGATVPPAPVPGGATIEDTLAHLKAELTAAFTTGLERSNAVLMNLTSEVLRLSGRPLPEGAFNGSGIGHPASAVIPHNTIPAANVRALTALAARSNFHFVQVPFGREVGTYVRVEFPTADHAWEFFLALMALTSATA